MGIHKTDTAVVFTDPQNEVLSENGGAWAFVRDSVRDNHTIENMERICKTAKQNGYLVFISHPYYYSSRTGGDGGGARRWRDGEP